MRVENGLACAWLGWAGAMWSRLWKRCQDRLWLWFQLEAIFWFYFLFFLFDF
jgi:hypothetical protein